jgi:hypothetical protein
MRSFWRRVGYRLASVLLAASTGSALAADPAQLAFRDAVESPPAGWNGPVFKLSHNYPTQLPTCAAPWLKRNVSFTDPNPNWAQWQGYIQDVIDYVWEGQDPNLPDKTGWKVVVNGGTRWFHVPWMAYDGERGREFAHGLTNELSTAEATFRNGGRGSGKHRLEGAALVDGQSPLFETWSVGMYNPCGAWSLGQAVPTTGVPAKTVAPAGRVFARGLPFREGTVVIKILNTTADSSQVPYLRGSTEWTADAHKQLFPTPTSPVNYATCERQPRKVHLVQMDIAVVDYRSPTHWVYSTLAYDGTLPGPTVKSRLVPLGVQWGNDSLTFPAVPARQSQKLRETVIAPINTPQHYGCQGRLAGVVDQANSSCVSCHMGAFAAPIGTVGVQGQNVPAIFSFGGLCTTYNTANKNYFSDYKYPQSYPSGNFKSALPLDSSLQLAAAFQNYAIAINPPQQPPPTCPAAGQ